MKNDTRILALAAGLSAVVAVVAGALMRHAPDDRPPVRAGERLGALPALETSRETLQSIVLDMRRRVETDPGDGEAAVLLADALMRTARVEGDPSLALEAERAIRGAIAHAPGDYAAQRMLGVVLLSQHRFTGALAAAKQAQRTRPQDAWNYAVMGDALLELGRYQEAFQAFDELNRRRPDSASYARAAYARELQGDIPGAIDAMQMAVEGTGAHDPEAQSWYRSQLGNLYLLAGRPQDAGREFARAEFAFPEHPYARTGRARVLIAGGRYRDAYTLLAQGHDTPETWALRGDIARRVGDAMAADSAYREAERLEREGWKQEEPQPAALARFLAERHLNLPEAVALAERAAADRRDIHTMDALAWAHFQAGQLDRAAEAIREALRTGTRDPRIRCHADVIDRTQRGEAIGAQSCDPLDTLAQPAAALAGPR